MAVTGQAVSSSLDRFVEETRQAWGSGQHPQLPYRIRGALERMIGAADPAEVMADGLGVGGFRMLAQVALPVSDAARELPEVDEDCAPVTDLSERVRL